MNQHDVAPLNQLAPTWRNVRLGTCSDATIGSDGCLVGDFSMIASTTPTAINTRMIERGLFYKGCLARTFDVQSMGYPAAPPLSGVTKAYQTVAFPPDQLDRVFAHVRAGMPAIACIDRDPMTNKFDQHWVLIVGAFGSHGFSDFIINDTLGGVQTSFLARYGNIARALVRVALYGTAERVTGFADARQLKRATIGVT